MNFVLTLSQWHAALGRSLNLLQSRWRYRCICSERNVGYLIQRHASG